MIDKDVVNAAISKVIAEEILSKISDEQKLEFFSATFQKAVSDWTFEHKIKEAFAEEAGKIALEMISSIDWQTRIRSEIQRAFEEYFKDLSQATQRMLREAFHGKEEGQYGRPGGIICKYLKRHKVDE